MLNIANDKLQILSIAVLRASTAAALLFALPSIAASPML
jgi:hypothetical protein